MPASKPLTLAYTLEFMIHGMENTPRKSLTIGRIAQQADVGIDTIRFYERRGFVATRFGVSPAPESEPDVQYEWKPE